MSKRGRASDLRLPVPKRAREQGWLVDLEFLLLDLCQIVQAYLMPVLMFSKHIHRELDSYDRAEDYINEWILESISEWSEEDDVIPYYLSVSGTFEQMLYFMEDCKPLILMDTAKVKIMSRKNKHELGHELESFELKGGANAMHLSCCVVGNTLWVSVLQIPEKVRLGKKKLYTEEPWVWVGKSWNELQLDRLGCMRAGELCTAICPREEKLFLAFWWKSKDDDDGDGGVVEGTFCGIPFAALECSAEWHPESTF